MPLQLAAELSGNHHRFVSVDVPVWAWVGLLAIILLLLGFDLVRHRDDHEPTYRESTMETLGWIACGLSFGGVVAWAWGSEAFGEYLNGYLIEKALSVDNVFVWSMIFSSMAIPLRYQHRVLFWGIFGALVFRAAFIFAGSALILRFWWLLVIFGLFLVYTGVRVIRHRDDEGEAGTTRGLGLLKRVIPVSEEFNGHNFFTVKNGVRMATPLLAALVVVEFTDIVFAVDSVPAILAVSREPFLVFASNAFAILGLRAMYFLLANAKERFHFLSHALGAVLIFVGVKMTFSHWYHMNTYLSLAIIASILVAGIAASQWRVARLAIGIHDEHH
ncbi:MAG: TerC family protein [Acidimicrobiales bacterium]